MKRILAILLTVVLVLGIAVPAYATGDGNIDGGGGSMGEGTSSNYWNPGMDGVRVTVVNAKSHAVVTEPVDLTNKQPPEGIIHFGKVSKISYSGGTGISPVVGGYSYRNPSESLPRIISSGSYSASIEAIRSYFTDEQVIRSLSGYVGMSFDTLINGNYKIVIEPIAYFHYNGQYFGMTATEAALYNRVVNGGLRRKMTSLTHKNLPLAIFLETPDLGYPAWDGSRTQTVNDEQIISSLGIGIVRFNEELEKPQIKEFDYEYRVDTDVITAVEVSGGQSDPDHPVTVQFIINGQTYTVGNVFYPDGDSQLAWVKWHTPSEPCVYSIQVQATGGGGTSQGTITANIVDLEGHDPPNPVADDRNDSFQPAPVPVNPKKTSTSWGIWSPWWQVHWVWHSSGNGKGHWVDEGWWEFDYNSYTASLTANMKITPDGKSPTATATSLKSGYGVQEKVNARVTTTQSSAVTAAQNAVTFFPEFGYQNFWRLLDRDIGGKQSHFAFRNNHFSTYNRPTHFTPIWYPDGNYTPYTYLLDCWTPTGMLSMNLTDTVTVRGDLWEEWHVAPTN